jgi:hypothetical protein
MKNLLLFIFFFIFIHNCFSSNAVIKGSVTGENNQPVPYANVILTFATDSSIVKAVITNENGEYQFENIEAGSYRILVAQLGFEKQYSEIMEINEESAAINERKFLLAASTVNLKEANVTAMKPLIEHRIDRTIVNVENSIVNAGATALEILKRSPGVLIDNDGNIALAGKQGVNVMIDGKPTYLSQRDLYELLRNTGSDQLSSIEINTNPSAKYDAAGNAGIINIRMKKKQHTGFNGRAQVSYGQGVYPDLGTGFNLNYGSEKFNLFTGYDYMNGYYYEKINLTKKFNQGDYTSTFIQHSFDKGQFINHSFRGGADFFLSKKHTLGFLAKGNQYNNDDNTTSTTDIYNLSSVSDSGYTTYNHNDSKWGNYSGNVSYRFQIDTLGRELTADADYAHYDNHNNFIFKTDHYFTGNDFLYTEIATDEQPATIDIKAYKADYVHPFNKSIKMEAGAKSSFVVTDNDVKYYNYYSNVAVLDSGKSNHFNYKENINAAYINTSAEIGKFGLQGGLRMEQTISEGKQFVDNYNFKHNYVEFFPSAFISYKFNDKHQTNASYSRRIDRPEYQQLNPFKYFIDPYNYMEGNPLLQPQLTNNFEISFTYLQMFTLAVKYSHTTDAMTQITKRIDSTHTTFVTTENLDSYDNFGINLNAPIKITEWLQSTNDFNLFRNKYDGISSVGPVETYLTSYTFNSTNSFSFPKGFTAELTFWYNSQMVWGTWLIDPQYSLSTGLSKMFMQDRFQLRVNFNDIFHTQITKSTTEFQNVKADFKRVFDSQFFRIHLAYKFGKQMQRSRMKRNGSEEEQNRVKQGR